ncbi:MAG: HAD-IB family hydrolase [Acidimicrobiia bacterium]|nr:HAD-IB family hydrolase [Acidimicrobiia bacterium]
MPVRRVAAFDFDRTLTTSDTLVPFLRAVVGTRDLALAAIINAPRFALAMLNDRCRDAAKAAVFRRVLAGRAEAGLRTFGERYADAIVTHRLRSGMPERIEWHRGQGHEIVIVSASPTLYLDAVGRRLGLDAVIATELEVGSDGCLTGEIVGANVRRAEKVRRLEAWLGGDAEIWAYGDSTGDRELLERADHAMRI